jgi:hypothetical protein
MNFFQTSPDDPQGIMSRLMGNPQGGGGEGIFSRLASGFEGAAPWLAYAQASPDQAHEVLNTGLRTNMLRDAKRKEQEEKIRKQRAMMDLLQKNKLDPALADVPEVAQSALNRAMTPRELSFEEKLYNQLPPEQRNQAALAKFGVGENEKTDPVYQAQRREIVAQRLGMKPGSPQYDALVATGRMPREDQQPLTATDKKAIMEADEGVMAAENGMASLGRALSLSPQAYEGPTAGIRGVITSNIGAGQAKKEGLATIELDNEVKTNALSQMKAIFGSNPTEGERQILLEIQGSSSMPHEARKKVYEKAQVLVQRRLEMNRQRASEMRGGTYYQKGGGTTAQPSFGTPPADGNTHEMPEITGIRKIR